MKIDFLSNVLKAAYADVISEWASQGLSEQQIEEKLTQENINNSTEQLFNQAVKDHNDFFIKHIYEISHSEKIKADIFFAHQNEIWGGCFAVSETMYVMAVEAAESYASFVKIMFQKKSMSANNTHMLHSSTCTVAVANNF